MIRDYGFRDILLSSIRWADANDRSDRMGMGHVRELGTSYDRTGGVPINPPVVRRSDKKLFSGHDRVAGCALMKQEHVTVHLLEGTDQEMQEVALIENAYRRHDDRDALKRQLVELRAAALSKRSVTKSPPRPGRPKSPEGHAREEIAPALRTTPAALKQAAYRDRKKGQEVSPAGGTEEASNGTAGGNVRTAKNAGGSVAPVTEIETFGLPISDELLATAIGAQLRIDKAARLLNQAQGELGGLLDVAGFDPTKAQDLRELVHRAAHAVRSARPVSLCPWCKGEPVICMACQDRRYADAGQVAMKGVPQVLLAGGDDVHVAIDGRDPVPLEAWRAQRDKGGQDPPHNRGGNRSPGGAANGGRNGKNGGVDRGR